MLATTTPIIKEFDEGVSLLHGGFLGTSVNQTTDARFVETINTGSCPFEASMLPVVMVDRQFGGYDDPMVVSDDDEQHYALLASHRRSQAIHAHLGRAATEKSTSEGVVLGEERISELAKSYSSKLDEIAGISNILSQPNNRASFYVHTLVALCKGLRASALFDPSGYLAISDASQKHSLIKSYLALLEPVFAESGYESSEPYDDGLGAIIVDFTRSADRVTFALTEDEVQILYIADGKIQSVEFNLPSMSLIEVYEFVMKRFA